MKTKVKKAVKKKPVLRKKSRSKSAKPLAARLAWKQLEENLYKLSDKTITAFVKAHPKDTYYAIFFDFAADWTQVRIHMSTPFHLRRRAEQYMRANPEHYGRRSVESVANEIRWEPGDFGYFEINNTPVWTRGWSKFAKLLKAAAAKQNAETYASGEFVELRFLLTVSRVLLQLER